MLDRLNYSPWLENLKFDWSELFDIGNKIHIKKGNILYNAHDQINFVYIIMKGRVQLFLINEEGKEKSLIIIGKNGLLGEYNQENNEYITYTQTVSDTILCKIPKRKFETLLETNKKLSEQRLEMLTMKLNLVANRLLQTSYDDSQSKVIRVFVNLAETYGEPITETKVKINIKFTHQEIAFLIGSTRVTVANMIKHLINSNLIEKTDGYYFINNINNLKSMI
ncbi:Crp/Fnr family transcriptional regulator [Pseudogracilibacillus sp. SO10305]|uniref:Crp/Fnr family transcriptional regulator n=1 Tax=Pseudogracilibacillus sp. SO10305 TaxID=3098292 RepID=UPI002B4B26A0|nr:Crp/Fnr family transcriptional regulator [Virgibacillus sp.]HLR68568.1 Crp/Fnr family transcriptional regulator [Virgibacillus sp.]